MQWVPRLDKGEEDGVLLFLPYHIMRNSVLQIARHPCSCTYFCMYSVHCMYVYAVACTPVLTLWLVHTHCTHCTNAVGIGSIETSVYCMS